jgi:hypothetical protein
MTKFILILILALLSETSSAQWATLYNYGTNISDKPSSIGIDKLGNTYVGGFSFSVEQEANYILIKYNSAGDTVWAKQYDGNISGQDVINALTIDNEGNIIVTGRSESNTGYDIATIKYSSSGEMIWFKRYSGSGNGYDEAFSISSDDSMNIYVSGRTQLTSTVSGFATVKYSKEGILRWAKVYNGNNTGMNIPNSMSVNKITGNVYLTGFVTTVNSGRDLVTIKYNRNGVLIWEKRYNGQVNGDDAGNALTIDLSENVFVTGFVTTSANNNTDFITIKYNSAGDSLWTKYYSGPGNESDIANHIAIDNSGSCYISGQSHSGTGGVVFETVTIKYDISGNQNWISHYSNNNVCCNHIPAGISLVNGGNLLVCDKSSGINSYNDFTIIKYNVQNGQQTGIFRYHFSGTNDNDVVDFITDDQSNCYVTGMVISNGNLNIGTLKVLDASIGIKMVSESIPDLSALHQNYPNPFNSSTVIRFQLRNEDFVTLKVYDVTGRIVDVLLNSKLAPGVYEINWNSVQAASGVYFYEIETSTFSQIRKMSLIK